MTKLQRWIDLLAALLRRNHFAPFEELRREVPGYREVDDDPNPARAFETRRRMFERDKQDLRSFGIPIQTRDVGDGELGYRLDRAFFYMPYLELMKDGRKTSPGRVNRYGYRSLPSLTFEPDELAAVIQAARRVESMGVPSLAADAGSALRKLGHDLPLDEAGPDEGVHVTRARAAADAQVFEQLSLALTHRKRVSFTYHSMDRDVVSERTVHPYGLFYLGHHWYLAGAAPGETLVKNYRLSRIGDLRVNRGPARPDYDIPAAFDLRKHAAARQAWELGSGDVIEATVRVNGGTGAALAAAALGEKVEDDPTVRRFRIRRLDAFARWILGAGGTVEPLAPPELVREYRDQVTRALALYQGGR